ncbi:MAG: hypothetical protein J0M04_13435 [Verrucomicrobia bacterium]|nr:hypothetical protein [Verrucomicrobiota bacterium]
MIPHILANPVSKPSPFNVSEILCFQNNLPLPVGNQWDCRENRDLRPDTRDSDSVIFSNVGLTPARFHPFSPARRVGNVAGSHPLP